MHLSHIKWMCMVQLPQYICHSWSTPRQFCYTLHTWNFLSPNSILSASRHRHGRVRMKVKDPFTTVHIYCTVVIFIMFLFKGFLKALPWLFELLTAHSSSKNILTRGQYSDTFAFLYRVAKGIFFRYPNKVTRFRDSLYVPTWMTIELSHLSL